MSGIFDQIINYSPPLIVSGTVNYKGTWDASTNNPTLNNPPASSTKGDYYVVSVAGTQFSISFAVGDWIISSGTAWEKVDLTDAVSSVFGRTGAVVGVSTDYSSVGLTNTAIGASSPSTGAFTTVSATTPIAVASGGTGVSTSTGTTNVVLSNSPTIVTPVIAQINDASGNETLKLASIASAVNEVTIENAATGNAVHISATGGDASIGLHLAGKGASGYVNVQDSVDATKRIMFNAAGGTTATRTMLSSTQTVDRTISLPDATDTLVGRATTDTLTNKTLTSPTLTAPVLGTPASGTVTNLTGTASININGTVGATTASTGVFTNVRIGSATSDELLTINGSSAGFVSRITSSAASNPNGFYYNSTNAIGTGTAFRVDSQGVSLLTLNSTGLAVTGALSATGSITIPNNVALGLVASGGTQAGYRFDASRNSVIDSDGTISFRTGGGTSFFTAGSFSAAGALTLNNGLAVTGALSSTTGANFATSSGSVGVGTASPTAKLQISTANLGDGGGIRITNTGAGGDDYRIWPTATANGEGAGKLIIGNNGGSRVTIDGSGNLLVGTTSAYVSSRFRVQSSGTGTNYNSEFENSAGTVLFAVRDDGYMFTGVAANSPYNITTGSAANCFINSDGGLYRSTSSQKYKRDITDYTRGLADVLKLRPVFYKGKSENDGENQFAGLIAEDVAEAGLDEFVVKAADGTPDALAYSNMVALTVKALQELNANLVAQVAALSQRISALETKTHEYRTSPQ